MKPRRIRTLASAVAASAVIVTGVAITVAYDAAMWCVAGAIVWTSRGRS